MAHCPARFRARSSRGWQLYGENSRLKAGDDPEALARLREELTAPRGNPTGANQYSGNSNNITLSTKTDLFTEPPKPAPRPKTAPDRGTRKDYTLSRLKIKREHPAIAAPASRLS